MKQIWSENLKDIVMKLLCGLAIGVGFVLPGVSGGVIAISMGLYERMLSAIRNIFSEFKRSLRFLLPIGVGGVAGVLLTSNVLKLIIERHESETLALFCGFVLGSLPTLYEETRKGGRRKPRLRDVLAALCGLLFVLLFEFLDTSATAEAAATAGQALPPLLAMLGGAVLAIGVVIPGLSSSFLLVYLGLYKSILNAIASVYLPTLFFAGLGFALAAALLILLVNYLLRRFHIVSYFAIMGIAVGSMGLIVPDVLRGFRWLCIPLLLLGLGLGLLQSLRQIRRTRRASLSAAGQEDDGNGEASLESSTLL